MDDFERTWGEVREAIRECVRGESAAGDRSGMALFDVVNAVCNREGLGCVRLYCGVRSVLRDVLKEGVVGWENVAEGRLLERYVRFYSVFDRGLQDVAAFMLPVEKAWVAERIAGGALEEDEQRVLGTDHRVFYFETLGRVLWREEVLDSFVERVSDDVLRAVERQRTGAGDIPGSTADDVCDEDELSSCTLELHHSDGSSSMSSTHSDSLQQKQTAPHPLAAARKFLFSLYQIGETEVPRRFLARDEDSRLSQRYGARIVASLDTEPCTSPPRANSQPQLYESIPMGSSVGDSDHHSHSILPAVAELPRTPFLQALVPTIARLSGIGMPGASVSPEEAPLSKEERESRIFRLYRDSFEHKFLEQGEAFYRAKSADMLAGDGVGQTGFPVRDYIEFVSMRAMQSEMDLATSFTLASTPRLLQGVLDRCLISEHKDVLYSEANAMLSGDCEGDLHNLYTLLNRIPGAFRPVQDMLRRHVEMAGRAALRPWSALTAEQVLASDAFSKDVVAKPSLLLQSSGTESTTQPSTSVSQAFAFVKAAWAVFYRFSRLTREAFCSDTECIASLIQGCERYINSIPAAPHLIAQFCHEMLQSSANSNGKSWYEADDWREERCGSLGSTVTDERDSWMARAARMFRFLSEKDVFQKMYALRLSRRLIYETSTSLRDEEEMLSILGTLCGPDYTSRLRRMFADMDVSTEETAKFHKSEDGSSLSFEFQALVLSSVAWPISDGSGQQSSCSPVAPRSDIGIACALAVMPTPAPISAIAVVSRSSSTSTISADTAAFAALPLRIAQACDSFAQQYIESDRHTGRKVTWMYQFSRVGLSGMFGEKEVLFEVSLVQAALLLQFNDQKVISVRGFSMSLGIPRDVIRNVLQLLLNKEILILGGSSTATGALSKGATALCLSDDTEVCVNERLQSPQGVVLRLALMSFEQEKATANVARVRQAVESDRRTTVQASIVRILKRDRVLDEEALLAKVVPDLARFPVGYSDIIQNIETLIENEYISREMTDGVNIFSYAN